MFSFLFNPSIKQSQQQSLFSENGNIQGLKSKINIRDDYIPTTSMSLIPEKEPEDIQEEPEKEPEDIQEEPEKEPKDIQEEPKDIQEEPKEQISVGTQTVYNKNKKYLVLINTKPYKYTSTEEKAIDVIKNLTDKYLQNFDKSITTKYKIENGKCVSIYSHISFSFLDVLTHTLTYTEIEEIL